MDLKVEILNQPSLRACVDGRRIRDLGRLMYDPRGSFDIQVVFAWRMYTPLGKVRSLRELPPPVCDCFSEFELVALCNNADMLVFDRICHGNDGRYRRPVRPAEWDESRVIPYEALGPQRRFGWGTEYERLPYRENRGSFRLLLSRNQGLAPKCRELLKAWQFLGLTVQPADRVLKLFWVVTDNSCSIYLGYLGEVTHTDLKQYWEDLVEPGNTRDRNRF